MVIALLELLFIFACIWPAQLLGQDFVLSEVFANGPGVGTDQGSEWFELYNKGTEPLSLDGLVVRRLDGASEVEAWRIRIDAPNSSEVSPKQFAVVAQSRDLGIGVCLDVPIVVIEDLSFRFKNSGVQKLCVGLPGAKEDCAEFSNSTMFPDGHSRFAKTLNDSENDRLEQWPVEECRFFRNTFATPGVRARACLDQHNPYHGKIKSCEYGTSAEVANNEIFAISARRTSAPVIAKLELGLDREKVIVRYAVFDPDENDVLELALFATTTLSTQAGILLSQGIPQTDESKTQEIVWDLSGMPDGEYHFFLRARDMFGNETESDLLGPASIEHIPEERELKIESAEVMRDFYGGTLVVKYHVSPPIDGNITFGVGEDHESLRSVSLVSTSAESKQPEKVIRRLPAGLLQAKELNVRGTLTFREGEISSQKRIQLRGLASPKCQCMDVAGGKVSLSIVCFFLLGIAFFGRPKMWKQIFMLAWFSG